jgi:hypothetical protein
MARAPKAQKADSLGRQAQENATRDQALKARWICGVGETWISEGEAHWTHLRPRLRRLIFTFERDQIKAEYTFSSHLQCFSFG